MTYIELAYSTPRQILANIDKASPNGHGNVIYSPWGRFRMYDSNRYGRFFSISKSTIFHNGGSYKFKTIRNLFAKSLAF